MVDKDKMIAEYNSFFEEIKKFQEKQDKQRQQGLNDYNMVNVVRKETAEVGMHSNVIFSLIDPDGLHYQGDLFLQLFIQEVLTDIKDDFGEIVSVEAEELTFKNRRIDFTIKSTKYYIGIEMKIDANDLENQLSHYKDDLLKKAKGNVNDVIIYYLTKDGKEADIRSIKIDDSDEKLITYKQVSFSEHILNWIEDCLKEIKAKEKENLINIIVALESYIEIVKKITGQYKGKIMDFESYIHTDNEVIVIKKGYKNILDEIDKAQDKIKPTFFKDLHNYLVDKKIYSDVFVGKSHNDVTFTIPTSKGNVILFFTYHTEKKPIFTCNINYHDKDIKEYVQSLNNIFDKHNCVNKIKDKAYDFGVINIQNKYEFFNRTKEIIEEIQNTL